MVIVVGESLASLEIADVRQQQILLTTFFAAAWKFLGVGNRATEGPLDSLYAPARRIRKVDTEAELSDIEEEIDGILKAERAKSAAGDESAVDDATLNVAAHRLESLIHDRRTLIATGPAVASAAKTTHR
jgi:hypothetical protein